MALLILWEVDHDQSFPTQGGGGLSAALLGFTRRLQQRAAQDPRLDWLESEDSALPLAPGLMPTHHRRWSVRVAAPAAGEPRGWYDTFVERWRAYLEAFVCPPGSRPMSRVSPAQLARVRPGVVPTNTTVAIAGADEASSSTAVTGAAGIPAASGAAPALPARTPRATRKRPRPAGEAQPRRRRPTATAAAPTAANPSAGGQLRAREEPSTPGPPTRRQRTLLGWVQPAAGEAAAHAAPAAPRHGRAVEGPPT
jgi:hypothetical protein